MGSIFQKTTTRPKASRLPQAEKESCLVIIGNGMVSARLCEELVAKNQHKHFKIKVIGEEPTPAYNRVKLSTYVDHRDASKLELLSAEWYAEQGIELILGQRVDSINRRGKKLTTDAGETLRYDYLVIATGSRPAVPPIPGADLPGVYLYRNIADLDIIISAAEGCKKATVIGGGLLGLEAAQALQSLGLDASVIERASFLMPQQLSEAAGALLKDEVTKNGISPHVKVQQTVLSKTNEGLSVSLDGADPYHADLVVISAGIIPNSELADECGLQVGTRGGIVVDGHMQTDDSSIFAIGECALHGGRIYGLVAPGYTMANHLAARLSSEKVKPLGTLDTSTRLKMLGVDVTTIGDPLEEGDRYEYQSGDHYRLIIIDRKMRVKGALAVGEWPENGRVHSLFSSNSKVTKKQIKHFTSEGILVSETQLEDITQWAEKRIVCNCMSVTKGKIMSCMATCKNDPSRIAQMTQATTVCGSCLPLVEQLCGKTSSGVVKLFATKALLYTSIIALLVLLYIVIAPPAPMAESVESFWYKVDQLWRDFILKQITGYSLMAVFLIGLVISLRKRFAWFTWGKFTTWKFFHAAFGLTSLIVLFAHTGFHFGHNLNFWLMFIFVSINILGALAGIVTAVESAGTSTWAMKARSVRPLLTWVHIILFWPLPVLLVFHIISAYAY